MEKVILRIEVSMGREFEQAQEMIRCNSDIIDLSQLSVSAIKQFSEDFLLEFSSELNIKPNLQTLLLLWEKQGFVKLVNMWTPTYEEETGLLWDDKVELFIKAILHSDIDGAQHIASEYKDLLNIETGVSKSIHLLGMKLTLKDKVVRVFSSAIDKMNKNDDKLIPYNESKYKELIDVFLEWNSVNESLTSKDIRSLLTLSFKTQEKYLFDNLIKILKNKINNRSMLTHANFKTFFPERYISLLAKEFAYMEKENYIRIVKNNWFRFHSMHGMTDVREELANEMGKSNE